MAPHECTVVKDLLELTNWPPKRIALKVQVHPNTIRRMRLSYELFGTPYPPIIKKTSRPRALTGAYEAVGCIAVALVLALLIGSIVDP
jgi:hypothetical protein